MELTTFWSENKKVIVSTALAAIVGLLVIKFFDFIFWGSVIVALCVGTVLTWNYLSKKHGGLEGIWKAFLE